MPMYDYQRRAVEWIGRRKKGWIALEPGLGKTMIALLALEPPALAVVPAFLMPNWLREVRKWAPDLRVSVATSTSGYDKGADLNLQSYATLHRLSPRKIRTLILDESHYAKSHTAKRTKTACKLVRNTENVFLLSGTPFLGRPIEFWPLLRAMNVTTMGYMEWGFRYCSGFIDEWGRENFRGASKLKELEALVGPYMFRMTKAEALKLPPKLRRLVVVNAPLDARERGYDVNQIIDAGSPVPFVGLAEVMHYHGLAKVAPTVEHCLDVLEQESKLIVFAHHLDVVEGIAEGLRKAGVSVETITGLTPAVKRDTLTERFQNEQEPRVLVGNVQAMGVGLTLTSCRYVVFAEASWSYAVNMQAESRIERIGQTLPMQIDYVVVDRSIDANVIEVAMFKKGVSDKILDNTRLAMMREFGFI